MPVSSMAKGVDMGGNANSGLFLGYKKLCGGDFRDGHLSQISTPEMGFCAFLQQPNPTSGHAQKPFLNRDLKDPPVYPPP